MHPHTDPRVQANGGPGWPSWSRRALSLPLSIALGFGLSGCAHHPAHHGEQASAATPPPTTVEQIGEYRAGSGVLNGYLDKKNYPNSLALLPPPPAKGSPAALADEAQHKQTRALLNTPRGKLAQADANFLFPKAGEVFACALDLDMSAEKTPHLVALMRRTMTDGGLSTYTAKDHYNRTRPFVEFKEASCDPAGEPRLVKDGSYPSGHSALGWSWALVLTEVAPDRADAILARGRAYGDSRQVCGVHWQSDVDAGRMVGAAAVARMHAEPVFQAQIKLAAAEVKAARAAGAKTARAASGACAAEAAALALK